MERKVEEPGFWDNPEESQKLMKELKHLKDCFQHDKRCAIHEEKAQK